MSEPKVEISKIEEPKVEEPKVEEPKVEEPKIEETKIEEKIEKPKRKYTKRKYLAEEKVEPKEEPTEVKVEPDPKRVKVTSTEEPSEEEPSFFRGGFVKPLLLAGIASASFWVNHVYKTTVPTEKKKASPPPQKKTVHKPQNFVFQSQSVRKSVVPGFTV